jgi:hypothetical protein
MLMTPDDFISSIKIVVHDSSVAGVVETLEHPAGRRPQQRLVELSRWFKALPPGDRARVEQVIQLAVHSGIFGMLSVLDGVSAIEDAPDKGRLELSHLRGGERHVLTASAQEFLHDIYQSHVYDQVFGA